MFSIRFSEEARGDLRFLQKSAQALLLDAIEKQLRNLPESPTRNRKPLLSNPFSRWELKVGTYRIFYDVDKPANEVLVKAVGWKEHNRLFFRGKEYSL